MISDNPNKKIIVVVDFFMIKIQNVKRDNCTRLLENLEKFLVILFFAFGLPNEHQ